MGRYPIYTEEAECRDCYKCVGRCPVKAIGVQNGRAHIIPSLCIFCGNCVTSCPARAKRVRGDVEQVKNLFRRGMPVYASLAPSFPAEFYGWTAARLAAALKRLGFYGVSETALGADFVAADIAAGLRAASSAKGGQKLFLSSACPAVVLYVKRYAPAFVPYLNDRASPLLAHALLLRRLYGKKIGVVFIGPCIAKKREADQLKEINAAITFDELKRWFEEEGIKRKAPEDGDGPDAEAPHFVPRPAAKGAFFPADGGELIALRAHKGFSKTSNMVISGIDGIAKALSGDAFDNDLLPEPLFVELLACQGGCVNGPCMTRDTSMIHRRAGLSAYAGAACDLLDAETAACDLPLTGTLTAVEHKNARYSSAEIRAALAGIEKYDAKDEHDCSMCGYESCRAFAAALLAKRAEKNMCAAYMRNLAQRKANAILNAAPSGIVIVDKQCKVVECNRNFARLLGREIEELFVLNPGMAGLNLRKVAGIGRYFEEAFAARGAESVDFDIRRDDKILHLNIYMIERGEIVAGVLDDITVPQIRRDKTIARAQKIIEKNVQSVQKIAFLLGENAAEIEGMLHSIIESHAEGKR